MYAITWIVTAIDPVKRSGWLLEILLVFGCVSVLIFTYRRLPFSDASYTLIFLFLVMHTVGAHYTYAEVPFGYYLKETLHLERNHFDRIVHFSFGIMAYPIQEIFVRVTKARGIWALLLPLAITISFSGFFEIIEAVIATLVNPELGTAYLGLQGDVWDAQKDMALAIIGAALAVGFGYKPVQRELLNQENQKAG